MFKNKIIQITEFNIAGDELACLSKDAPGSTEPRFFRVSNDTFYIQGDFLVYKIIADSFLYRMVRSVLGTLLEFEKCKKTCEEFIGIVGAMDRSCAGPTAPARGLFLDKVIYSDVSPLVRNI